MSETIYTNIEHFLKSINIDELKNDGLVEMSTANEITSMLNKCRMQPHSDLILSIKFIELIRYTHQHELIWCERALGEFVNKCTNDIAVKNKVATMAENDSEEHRWNNWYDQFL